MMTEEEARLKAQEVWHRITEEAIASSLHGIMYNGDKIAEIIADALLEAAKPKSSMSKHAEILLAIYCKHVNAARDGDRERRERMFRLLEDFEWAYPDARDEVKTMFPPKAEDA
jgi:hypothetical protein